MKKFWNWKSRKIRDQDSGEERIERVLFLNGTIAEESWYDDEVTPALFKEELMAGSGDVTVWINSPGGDCVAAAQIYNMLMDYKGNVTVKIDGLAASAASVIAMAGTKVLISPVGMLMIHNPATIAWGDSGEMQKAIEMLESVKDSIINAYEIKTGLSRAKLSRMMDAETWMDAGKAVELGFADGILKRSEVPDDMEPPAVSMLYSEAAAVNSLMDKIAAKCRTKPKTEPLGRASEEYRTNFWNAMRSKVPLPGVVNALEKGTDFEGGYLVPDEYERTLVEALEEENVFRQLANVIRTSSGDRKIPVVATKGTASWIDEEGAYTESDDSFGPVSIGAYKVGTMIKVSEELLNDSVFDLESYIAKEFARRIGAKEEEAFFTGDGSGKPLGVLAATGGAETGVTAASSTAVTAGELMDLFYSLKSPYRKKAVWVLNDSTIKAVRKLKDSTGQYLWQPSLMAGTPDTLLGRPVKTSAYMPVIAAGAKTIAFGDFSYYWIADRQGRSFKRLNELYAANGQVGFLGSQRVDGKLVLSEAVKVLAQKASA